MADKFVCILSIGQIAGKFNSGFFERLSRSDSIPSAAKAVDQDRRSTYGLKPVPFKILHALRLYSHAHPPMGKCLQPEAKFPALL
jgi:hypothetical protein